MKFSSFLLNVLCQQLSIAAAISFELQIEKLGLTCCIKIEHGHKKIFFFKKHLLKVLEKLMCVTSVFLNDTF